jgi:hypothetical protein
MAVLWDVKSHNLAEIDRKLVTAHCLHHQANGLSFLPVLFLPKMDEATGEWRKLHSGELHNLYTSPGIIRQTKSRRMRWAGHVARMGEGRNV